MCWLRLDASLPCFTLGEVCLPSAVRARRCATTPWHGMSKRAAHLHGACCARGHVSWCRGTTRAVRSCNLVDVVPSIRVRLRTQTSTPTRSLPVLREQFQPGALPHASRRNTNLTSTDCDVNLGTESECESCKASSENQVLCAAVITKAEGRGYSQMYRIP